MKKYRIILSGGGTGGHIYPAVAVAEALRRKTDDNVELLFVGAEGKMEMEKVPALGYRIKGLPMIGLQRKLALSNVILPIKVQRCIRKAKAVIRKFDADVVAGFGGYASGPTLWAAQRMKIPTLIQEQNSYPGITNRILAKRADRICVAYDDMERFFPADKIIPTGNPLRGNFADIESKRVQGLEYFGLDARKPALLILGGSLGTRTLNEMMKRAVDDIVSDAKMQVIWQTGKFYEREIRDFMSRRSNAGIWYGAFIDRMDYAYAAADVVISRSGAITVSELCLVGKPTIFVPSPNVSEDHQTKNARALADRGAAVIVPDPEAVEKVIEVAEQLLADATKREELSLNMCKLATPDAADRIADMILALAAANTGV